MSRSLFPTWGGNLSDEDFAQALAAAGVLGSSRLPSPDFAKALEEALSRGPRVKFELGWNISVLMQPSHEGPKAELFRDAWRKVAKPKELRLEVHTVAGEALPKLDKRWLSSLLRRDSVAAGVFFIQDEPRVPVSWWWPLRIGLMSDPRSQQLAKQIAKSHFARLFRIIEVDRVRRECDVLLLPYSLRSSVGLVLGDAGRMSADCVIVMGKSNLSPERTEALMATLRSEIETAGVAICSVERKDHVRWFNSLIVELSHNKPLDVALALIAPKGRAPLLIAARRLLDVARLSAFVDRLGAQLNASARRNELVSVPPHAMRRLKLKSKMPLRAAAKVIRDNAEKYEYLHESDDAEAVVELRGAVESALEEPVTLAMANGGGGEPEPAEARDDRHVQADFLEPDTQQRAENIAPQHQYLLQVLIALPDEEADRITATRGIPQLERSATGHELRILFSELSDGDRKPLSRAQHADVHLPPTGPSTEARFAVQTAKSGRFVARLVVMHRMRVLQTLILAAPIPGSRKDATLVEETIVRQGFGHLDNRRPFDAALIVNHNTRRTPGVGIATRNAYSFDDIEGIRLSIDKIQEQLSTLAEIPDKKLHLKNDEVLEVIRILANHGRIIWDVLRERAPEELASATRVQVVETSYGSYLPVEFFYDQFAPANKAKLCPHGTQVLLGKSKAKCPNRDNPKFVCAAAFWGFNRIIERRPPTEQSDKKFEISEPSLDRPRIEILGNTLVGWSEKVSKADVTGSKGILKALGKLIGTKPETAKDWEAWKKLVESKSPSLLVLLAHSLEDPAESGLAALEIGKKNLRSSNLERPYVRKENREPGPAVLLLGCSTELTSIPFHNFVSRFRAKGAALVLGTLASIRGSHAARFLPRFIAELKKQAGTPEATFGGALLEVKRQMFAAGDPFVLTLVAYGDADWRL